VKEQSRNVNFYVIPSDILVSSTWTSNFDSLVFQTHFLISWRIHTLPWYAESAGALIMHVRLTISELSAPFSDLCTLRTTLPNVYTSTSLPLNSVEGGGHVSSIRRDALHELPRGTVVLAIAHQLIPCMASDSCAICCMLFLLQVLPRAEKLHWRKCCATGKHIDTIVVQQETCLWTFLVRCKHWFGDSVLRHRILSRVISSFLSLRPAWYFPEITFIIYLSINPWCLRIGRFLLPWMPLFNFTARAAWAVNYALRNAMEGTGGFTEGAARSNCQEGLTKAVGYVG